MKAYIAFHRCGPQGECLDLGNMKVFIDKDKAEAYVRKRMEANAYTELYEREVEE